jgi:hypothetical protein
LEISLITLTDYFKRDHIELFFFFNLLFWYTYLQLFLYFNLDK